MDRRRIRAVLVGTVAVLAALVMTPVAAGASPSRVIRPFTVSKFGGSVSCGGGAKVVVEILGSGDLKVFVNNHIIIWTDYYSNISTIDVPTNRTSVSAWEVTSDGGYLDDNGTFAFCQPPGGAPPA